MFETHELVVARIDERIRGMTWEEIGNSEPLHHDLVKIQSQYPQIESLWLIDPDGVARNSSVVLPKRPLNGADRDFFVSLRERDLGTFIGGPMVGRLRGLVNFNVAQRRTGASKAFDGVIVVSVSPRYFTDFWKKIAPPLDIAVKLVRKDGVVLAREPVSDAEILLGVDNPLMQAIQNADSGTRRMVSNIDGISRFYGYKKIDAYPVYLVYGVGVGVALHRWYAHLAVYGCFFGLATIALTFMAVVAARRARREAMALHHWREAARQLRAEAERRGAIEDQLRQSQKMDALGQMTSGVAHDFSNILTIVIGNLELLSQHVTTPRSAALAENALKAAERGTKAIQNLLSFARRQPLRSEIFDPNAALLNMTELFRQSLGSNIRLDMMLCKDAWPVEADLNQANLAVLNLVVNARDAMPEGGVLTVQTTNVRLNGDLHYLVGDFVLVTIADTGTGIKPDVMSRVFEPFFTTKEASHGTGLGLSMVYGFAKQSGGTVTIESAVGQGTTIMLYLPRGMKPDAIDHERHSVTSEAVGQVH